MKMKSSIDQKISELLNKDENETVIRMLGNKCQSLAMAVIQLFITQAPDHSNWFKKDTGVMVFVKDNCRRNYFFRMYCLNRKNLIWEQEMYNNLEYNGSCDYFHIFEADDCLAAFNFASEQEAYDMKKIVLEKLQMKRQRREERRARNMIHNNKLPQSRQDIHKPVFQSNTSLNYDSYHNNQPQIIENQQTNKTNKKRRHITKADISLPKDFKHVSHVGWDPNKGFDIENIEDPQLKQFFNKAGVSDIQLRDKDTREFIYDFINTHGGIDAVKKEVVEQNVPKKQPSKQENTSVNPPPVPARTAVNRSAPPPPPGKTKPPNRAQPPPRPNNIPRAPEPPPQNVPVPPPPPPMGGPVPPPPPPAGLISPPPPPATPPEASLPPVNDARSALLESIKAGKTLRPVEQVERKPSVGDSRGDLLKEIQQGIELKPVVNLPKTPNSTLTQNSLAAALSDALKNRALAIQSEESASSEEDDDEWD